MKTFFISLLLFSAFTCFGAPKVVVSIAPFKEVVQKIAQEKFDVVILVPAGASPHSYEPSTRQLVDASEASVWFRVGEGFEKRALEFLGRYVPVVDLREGLHLIEESCCHHHHLDMDAHDVHVWLSPRCLLTVSENVTKTLSHYFPEYKAFFENNLALYQQELKELDSHLQITLKEAKGETLLVSHPAFGYFCRDYELFQLPVEIEGKEPSPKQVLKLLKEAKKRSIHLAIAQPQYSRKGIEKVALELELPIYTLDPYQENVSSLLYAIANLLSPA